MSKPSTHQCPVVAVNLEPHPATDQLSLVKLFDGAIQVVVRTEEWVHVPVGVYIPPDNCVPDTPAYAFLKGKLRIKPRRFGGEWSVGMLVQAPEGYSLGDDASDILGITHYEPPVQNLGTGGEDCAPPKVSIPSYDLEPFFKYHSEFSAGDKLVLTEKLHGAQGRFVQIDGEIFCGSRNHWKREDRQKNAWWKALDRTPTLEAYLRKTEGVVFYGEVYGAVQNMRYGHGAGEVSLAIFDIAVLDKWSGTHRWMNVNEMFDFCRIYNIPAVPIISGLYTYESYEEIAQEAEGMSLIANHLREGVVLWPFDESAYPWLRCRPKFKIVGKQFLSHKKS